MMLANPDNNEALRIAEQVRKRIESLQIPRTKNTNEGNVVTVSIGMASMSPLKTQNKESLIELADQALYEAKHQGRNNVVEELGGSH